MKTIKMFVMAGCPHCFMAKNLMKELESENSTYKNVEFEIIDENENSTLANSYDYWHVPSYFIENEKLHEGRVTKDKIRMVYERALEKQKA